MVPVMLSRNHRQGMINHLQIFFPANLAFSFGKDIPLFYEKQRRPSKGKEWNEQEKWRCSLWLPSALQPTFKTKWGYGLRQRSQVQDSEMWIREVLRQLKGSNHPGNCILYFWPVDEFHICWSKGKIQQLIMPSSTE